MTKNKQKLQRGAGQLIGWVAPGQLIAPQWTKHDSFIRILITNPWRWSWITSFLTKRDPESKRCRTAAATDQKQTQVRSPD
jgi:hypothetical protein